MPSPQDWDEPLTALRWHWGSAYLIDNPVPGVWTARRRDTHATLRADTALGLRDRIVADYAARPVPRPLDEDAEKDRLHLAPES
jgi:hypothetical protein